MIYPGSLVVVGVVDSGWDRSVPDTRILQGVGLVGATENQFQLCLSSDDHDRIGHGTACANLVLSVANCVIVPIRVFGSKLETSPNVLIQAIEWTRKNGIKLVNLSVGTIRQDCVNDLYNVCRRAEAEGMILVAAANDTGGPWFPAEFGPVLSVGSAPLEDLDSLTYRPGQAIECRLRTRDRPVKWLGNETCTVHGSSFATPIVTGMIARWLRDEPGLDLAMVRARLSQFAEATIHCR